MTETLDYRPDTNWEHLSENATLESVIDKYFCKFVTTSAYPENFQVGYISKNSKFLLDANDNGQTYSLITNTDNMNNSKIKKYWELNRDDYGGDFRSLSEENLIKLIKEIYEV